MYVGYTNAIKMFSSWTGKIVLVLWITLHCCVAIDPSREHDCREKENKYNISCEGNNITLSCPQGKPQMQITDAIFGRTQSERVLCRRPGNKHPERSGSVRCIVHVEEKVKEICADQSTCVFNVNNITFPDPCPHVYKYIWIRFTCNCRQRLTRNPRSTSCIHRKTNTTMTTYSTYTIIQPTPILTTIGQSMSQNVTNSTYVPIKMTIKPSITVSTQRIVVTTTISVNSSRNSTLILQQHKRAGNKIFFLLLELFAAYNEAANEDPPMALMWCFIGILLGLFIITMTFLFLGIRGHPRDKKLFSLSQLESEESEIQSPTIHTSSQFPESPELERRQAAVEKFKAKKSRPVGKNFPGMGSWSDLLKADTSLYINPLWRGWQEEYMGLTAQGADTGNDEREGLSRSEPWNLSAAAENDDIDHRATNSNSSSDDQQNNNTITNNQQPTDNNPEQSTSNIDPLQAPTNNRRSVVESDPNFITSIPVGIPSHPVPDPKIFNTEPTRIKNPETTTPEASNATNPKVGEDHTTHATGKKPSSSINDFKNPSNNLLSKFGIYSDDIRPTQNVCSTAISSPRLLSEEFNQPDKQDLQGSPRASLKVRSRPLRSLSLDSSTPANTSCLNNTYTTTPHNPTPTLQNPPSHNPTIIQHQNKPPPYVTNKNSPSIWPKVQVDNKMQKNQAQNIPKRLSKKSPTDSRASSGYYSNNTSPLVEYPADINSSHNSARKTEQQLQKQLSDDDLPPLPPPPPPLIPISPLPHMCVSGYRETDENNLDKNPLRTATRKVHFKSSE